MQNDVAHNSPKRSPSPLGWFALLLLAFAAVLICGGILQGLIGAFQGME
jgi:hypothetical protein